MDKYDKDQLIISKHINQVIVGSLNPVKLNAVKEALRLIYPSFSFEVKGIKVESGVSAMPMTDDEIRKGASQRALNAHLLTGEKLTVGLEGGLSKIDQTWYLTSWTAVFFDSFISQASSLKMPVPYEVGEKIIHEKVELGEVIDLLVGENNVKQERGAIGVFTSGLISRTELFRSTIICAFAPLISSKFFDLEKQSESLNI